MSVNQEFEKTGSIAYLCDEYLKNNFIDPEASERLGVKRGLRNPDGTGVLAGLTNVCDVVGYDLVDGKRVPTDGKLIYRGIDVEELIGRQIDYNTAISDEGLKGNYGVETGRILMENAGNASGLNRVRLQARAAAAAGSDARMSGCSLPVVINSGSGNQGITVTMPGCRCRC